MKKDILLSGLLGGIVIFLWMIVSTSLIPINGDQPDPIPNDKEIQTLLKERITEPGVYFLPDHPVDNPELYPDYGNEPIFSIIYGGRTSNSFRGELIWELFCFFAAPLIAAWLLSKASDTVLKKYSRRVLYVAVLGLFLAIYADSFSMKPMENILLSSLNYMVTWTLAGLVIAWRIKPKTEIRSKA